MDWSALFQAPIVVLGCGNTLFGDDGLAPRAVSLLAEEAKATGQFPHVAFVDAGTSVRSLLTDLTLCPSVMHRLIVVDVVQEAERAAGTIVVEHMQANPNTAMGAKNPSLPALGDSFLHQAPTRALLQGLHATLGIELMVVTVQAAYIPPLMDDSLSPAARAALPLVQETVRDLCRPPFHFPVAPLSARGLSARELSAYGLSAYDGQGTPPPHGPFATCTPQSRSPWKEKA